MLHEFFMGKPHERLKPYVLSLLLCHLKRGTQAINIFQKKDSACPEKRLLVVFYCTSTTRVRPSSRDEGPTLVRSTQNFSTRFVTILNNTNFFFFDTIWR